MFEVTCSGILFLLQFTCSYWQPEEQCMIHDESLGFEARDRSQQVRVVGVQARGPELESPAPVDALMTITPVLEEGQT